MLSTRNGSVFDTMDNLPSGFRHNCLVALNNSVVSIGGRGSRESLDKERKVYIYRFTKDNATVESNNSTLDGSNSTLKGNNSTFEASNSTLKDDYKPTWEALNDTSVGRMESGCGLVKR